MDAKKDFREFIELCLSKEVEFLVVGGFALMAHGAPRFTEDMDLLIAISNENAARIFSVLEAFGLGNIGIVRENFLAPEQVIQLGRKPNRIDILTSISGVSWAEAWAGRVPLDVFGQKCWALGREQLVRNKLASGRPHDLFDVERLNLGDKADSE